LSLHPPSLQRRIFTRAPGARFFCARGEARGVCRARLAPHAFAPPCFLPCHHAPDIGIWRNTQNRTRVIQGVRASVTILEWVQILRCVGRSGNPGLSRCFFQGRPHPDPVPGPWHDTCSIPGQERWTRRLARPQ
jgi:hypothetical protein